MVSTPHRPLALASAGNLLFVAVRDVGAYGSLSVVDLSTSPLGKVLATIPTSGTAYGLAVAGDGIAVCDGIVYLAGGAAGLHVINVSSPIAPSVLGQVDTPRMADGVAASGDHVLVAGGEAGLQVMPIECTAAGISQSGPASRTGFRISIAPDPTLGQVTIRLDAPSGRLTGLGIFDLAGRHVRELPLRGIDSGRHEVVWDGRDEQGRAVASGIYYIRIAGRRSGPAPTVALLR